ncbi:hypothetical protein CAP47_08855 [Psychroflexus sp. S27]|uniref:hypothetical protein n=1 Tax=Psychroflexus sp. S27 TaxID=1982757 RepID=UPI000C2A2A06|nr:hypothetical protein [Psychroflexus sp. S27]PJX21727.1 hypothetical protein CAP47_08855 [Psychroflexus sp. S27]
MRKIKGLFYAETVSGSCRIDMRFMLKNNYIIRGAKTSGVLEWTGGQAVNFKSQMKGTKKYLRLIYSVSNHRGERTDLDYKIEIDEVPSNLKKGKILYFLCPESGKRSRTLISAYGEPKFINREYYETKYGLRVYYGCQRTSKNDYHNTRYFDLKRKVERLEAELNEKHRNTHYRGKPTREQNQLAKWKQEMNYHDQERLKIFNAQIKKQFSHW